MFKNFFLNQLVLTFEFALETFDPINFTSFNTQLKSISLSELESKTVDRSLNLIEYLCHIPAYFECTTFSRCLFALMDSITQKFYQQESEVGFDFFESSGVISVDLIFDLLKQKNVKTALQLLEIYQALFSRFPDLKRLFTDRVLLKLHDSSELDLINQYGFWDLPRLHFFMNKLLEITFPGSRILFDKKIFLPSQQVHFKMYLLFEFYFNFTKNKKNLLTSLGNYGDENSKKQHLNLISYLLREFPELRVVLNTHLHRKAGRKFWFFQNIAEFSFLNDIFLKNILVVYPHLSDFQTLLLSILDGKSIFEKLFLEARTPIMRHELLNCYCELLKKNAFAGLATQVHFGEEIPDVVSFVRQRNPLSLEFFQYLDFIYLTYIHHIISSDLLKTILFGRENNTVNYLLSLRSSSLYLMFTNHLFENYQSLSENFQHLIGMREYLLSSKPLLLAMERNDEAIVESLMELYSSYFSVEELLKIIRCYQSIVQIKAQEHLVFDPDEEEQQLVTQIDLGFLVDDDLKHLEETLDIDEPPTSSLSR